MDNFRKITVTPAAQRTFDNIDAYTFRKNEMFWIWWKNQHKYIYKHVAATIQKKISKLKNFKLHKSREEKINRICNFCNGWECDCCTNCNINDLSTDELNINFLETFQNYRNLIY